MFEQVQWFFKPGIYIPNGQGHGRVAGTITRVYEFNIVIKSHHIDKTVCIALTDEILLVHVWEAVSHCQTLYCNVVQDAC